MWPLSSRGEGEGKALVAGPLKKGRFFAASLTGEYTAGNSDGEGTHNGRHLGWNYLSVLKITLQRIKSIHFIEPFITLYIYI